MNTAVAAVLWLVVTVLAVVGLDLLDASSAVTFFALLALLVALNIDLARRLRRRRRQG